MFGSVIHSLCSPRLLVGAGRQRQRTWTTLIRELVLTCPSSITSKRQVIAGMETESAFSAYSKNQSLILNNTSSPSPKMKDASKSPSKIQKMLEKRKREILTDNETDVNTSIDLSVQSKKKRKFNNSVEKKDSKKTNFAKKSAKEIINGKRNESIDDIGSDGSIFDIASPGKLNVLTLTKAKKSPKVKVSSDSLSSTTKTEHAKKASTPKKPKAEKKIRRSKSADITSLTDSNKSLQDFLSSLISDDEDGSEVMEIMTEINKEKEVKEGLLSSEKSKKAAKKTPKNKSDKTDVEGRSKVMTEIKQEVKDGLLYPATSKNAGKKTHKNKSEKTDDEDNKVMQIKTEIEEEVKEELLSSENSKKTAKKTSKNKSEKASAAKTPDITPVTKRKKKDLKSDESNLESPITKTKTPKSPQASKSDSENTTPKKKAAGKKIVNSLSDITIPVTTKTPSIKSSKSNITPGGVKVSAKNKIEDETSSIVEGENLFRWLIHPVELEDFYKTYWEQRPLHIERDCPTYYKNLISSGAIDKMLTEERIEFTKNIDITSYVNGVRETHNPPGRALPSHVWDAYSNGCSVRLLNPQTFIHKLNLLCATMQEYFTCMVGANSYLTPEDSQGFAPHYDDIEAFVVQVEGKKRWKLYAPRSPSETLPRHSSPNFTEGEIGQPIMDIVLCPGDVLYFPRGTIHQASTVKNEHSLHITLSVYQKHSYGDLLEMLLPGMLATAISEDVTFRQGLPLDISRHFGLVYNDRRSDRRTAILQKLKSLIDKMIKYAPFDAAVDQFFKQYQHNALPPVVTPQQATCTVFGGGEVMSNGKVTNRVEFSPDTRVRLLRANILRMVMEEEQIRIYYHTENLKEYQAVELQYLEIDETQAPAIEQLITTYPKYVSIKDLIISGGDNQLKFTEDLWLKGLIVTSKPLECIDDD